MLSVLVRAGRVWLAHWPALLAWLLGGTLVHFLVLKLASFVGAQNAVGGILLLPVAALALLIAYVAMFLVVRDGMPGLRGLAPLPSDPTERRDAFLSGVLGGILPFVAFYAAWGFIREDVITYTNDAFEWQFIWGFSAALNGRDFDSAGTIDDLGINPLTIGLLVIAFVGRWAYKRYGDRVPHAFGSRRVFGVVAVYLEALWVYLAAYLITDLVGLVTGWVETRQGTVWLGDLRDGLTGWLAPLGILWDGVGWLLGEVGGIILLPLAWLTIAGVIYGQAVKATTPRLSGTRFTRVRARYGSIPARARRRISDFWDSLVVSRFRPVGAAIVLMWRAGPVLIGGYILLFTVVEFGLQWLLIGVSRALGPHEYLGFWVPMSVALVMIATLLVEPLRVAVIAATYDQTVTALADADRSAGDVESHVSGNSVGVAATRDRDEQPVGGIARQQDETGEVERDR